MLLAYVSISLVALKGSAIYDIMEFVLIKVIFSLTPNHIPADAMTHLTASGKQFPINRGLSTQAFSSS